MHGRRRIGSAVVLLALMSSMVSCSDDGKDDRTRQAELDDGLQPRGDAPPQVPPLDPRPPPPDLGPIDETDVWVPPIGEPLYGGELEYALERETRSWDPTLASWSTSGLTIASTFYDTLMAFDQDGVAQPY